MSGAYDDTSGRYSGGGPAAGAAAQNGLASLFVGGLLAVTAPLVLIVNLMLFMGALRQLSRDERQLAVLASLVGLLAVAGMCLAAAVFAVRGIAAARRTREPAALPAAGLLVTAFAAVFWVGVGLDLLAILLPSI